MLSGYLTVSKGDVTPSCERYEPATGRWTLVCSSVTGWQQFVAFAVNSEEVMALGRLDANLRSLNTVEILNICTRQSCFVASVSVALSMTQERYVHERTNADK